MNTNTVTAEERILGCLAGIAVGDAMGMPTSFLTPQQIRAQFGQITTFVDPEPGHQFHDGLRAGQITDDTEQALALVRSFMRHKRVDSYDIALELLAWAKRVDGKYISPLGPSTQRALQSIMDGISVQEAGRRGDTNGAAMRVAPLGILHGLQRLPAEIAVNDVERTCLPTHGTSAAIAGAAAVTGAIAACFQAANTPEEVVLAAAEMGRRGQERGVQVVAPSIAKRLEWVVRLGSDMRGQELVATLYDLIGAGMAAAETVPFALGVFLAADGDPREAILLAVNAGGDCDTTAAIAGAVAGAFRGIGALPAEWIDTVEQVNALDLRQTASDLLALSRDWQPALDAV